MKIKTIEDLQQEMYDVLMGALPKLTDRDKELIKEYSKPSELVGWDENGKMYFYEKENIRTIYAHQICENNELRNLKNKLVRLGISSYCTSIGLSINFYKYIK